MDKNSNSIAIHFNDDKAIEVFNKFSSKHGFKDDKEVILAAYLIMLHLDDEYNLQFLQNGKFLFFAPVPQGKKNNEAD